MEKMYKAHLILDNVRAFHVHSIRRNQLLDSIQRSSIENSLQCNPNELQQNIIPNEIGYKINDANVADNSDNNHENSNLNKDTSTSIRMGENNDNLNPHPTDSNSNSKSNDVLISNKNNPNEIDDGRSTKDEEMLTEKKRSSDQLKPNDGLQPEDAMKIRNNENNPSTAINNLIKARSIDISASSMEILYRKEDDHHYMINLDAYNPIQPMRRSHQISMIPLEYRLIDYHILQCMHHGTTIIHYEEDTGRSSLVYLQLEQSNSIIAWCKPFWSTSLKVSGNTPQDYQLSLDIEDFILPGISLKFETKEPAIVALEEGFVDLMYLKDVIISQKNIDLSIIGRRHGFNDSIFSDSKNCSLKLLFGSNLSDNRTTEFIAPKKVLTIWIEGLKSILRLLRNQKLLIDQRITWLKEKYLQSYYEESMCQGPTIAEAIRIFGGRKWTVDAMGSSHHSLQTDTLMNFHHGPSPPPQSSHQHHHLNYHRSSNSNKLRKKKSTNSFSVNRDFSNRSQLSINSVPDSIMNICRSDHSTPIHCKSKPNSLQTQSIELINNYPVDFGDPKHRKEIKNKWPDSCHSWDNLARKSTNANFSNNIGAYSPIQTSIFTSQYREKYCKRNITNFLEAFSNLKSTAVGQKSSSSSSSLPFLKNQSLQPASTTRTIDKTMQNNQSSNANLSFFEFTELFRSFMICIRRDVKDIFEQIASKSNESID